MHVADAQREVRTVYLGGFMGQLVSGALWLASAALGSWSTPRQAIVMLVVGGMFIFPLTQLGLKLMGRRASLAGDNPFRWLAMQIAFTVPLSLPLVGAAALYRLDWFYPAMMVVVGAHYLPFMSLYGMRMFGVLGSILLAGGVALGMWGPPIFVVGGWATGVVLLVFAVVGRELVGRERAAGETGRW
jgi:hypothetical protein